MGILITHDPQNHCNGSVSLFKASYITMLITVSIITHFKLQLIFALFLMHTYKYAC